MQNIPTKIDGVSTLPAAEFNQIPDELENLITSNGVSLSGSNVSQVAQAVSTIASHAIGFTDAGTANAKILTPTGSRLAPTAYTEGMIICFVNAVANTGACTVNVSGLGAAGLVAEEGNALSAGALAIGQIVMARYTSGSFRITNQKSLNEIRNIIADTQAFDTGLRDQLASTVTAYVGSSIDYSCSGSSNAYILSSTGNFAPAPGYFQGQVIRFSASFTNSGACTVSVNGGTTTPLRGFNSLPLTANMIQTGDVITARYNGAEFIMISHSAKGYGPIFEGAYQTVPQTLNNNTVTTINFDTSSTNSITTWMNLSTDRWTPRAQGNYLITAGARLSGLADPSGNFDLYIVRNGVTLFATSVLMASTSAEYKSCLVSGVVTMNGTTDYIEIAGFQTSGVARNTSGTQETVHFSAVRI